MKDKDRETTMLDGEVVGIDQINIRIRIGGHRDDKLKGLDMPEELDVPRGFVIGGADVVLGDTNMEVKHSWIKLQPWWKGKQSSILDLTPDQQKTVKEFQANDPRLHAQSVVQSGDEVGTLSKIEDATLAHAFDHASLRLLEEALRRCGNDKFLTAALLNAAARKAQEAA